MKCPVGALRKPASHYLPLLEDKKVRVKIFSVKFDGELHGDWKPRIIDELTKKLEDEKGG